MKKYLSVVLGIATSAIAFGYLNAHLFLRVAYGSQWATQSCVELFEAGMVLTLFCGLNGITEGFAYA